MEDKEQINLISEIWKDVKTLNSLKENEEIINYFLTKDIFVFFGKENFFPNEMEINRRVTKREDSKNEPCKKMLVLQTSYNGEEYLTSSFECQTACQSILKSGIKHVNLKENNSVFSILKEENRIDNCVTYLKKGYRVTEQQSISFAKTICFDYQIHLTSLDGKEIIYQSPRLRAEPIPLIRKGLESVLLVKEVKNNENKFERQSDEVFSMELLRKIMKSYYENLMEPTETISVPFGYSSLGISASIPDIFLALENKVKPECLKEEKDKKSAKRQRIRKHS